MARPKSWKTDIRGTGAQSRAVSAALRSHVATTADGRDITRPYVRGLQQPRDPRLLRSVDWGVYDKILEDDQVFSTLQQRRGAVVSRDWNVVPGEEDDPRSVAAADALRANLIRIGWDRITDKMLFAPFYGYAVAELMWQPRGGRWEFGEIKVRHARRFRYNDDGALRLLTPQNMTSGEELPDRKFWVASAGASDDDEPYGRGLAEWLYWPTLFKRNGVRFWNNFTDRYSTPTAVGKYRPGTALSEVDKLLAALQAFATDSGIAIPDGMAIELMHVAQSGSITNFETLCKYMDAAIAKVVLSQTMTTDDGASLSQAKVHAGVKLEVVKSDADILSDSFNQGPARWFCEFNFGADVEPPRVMRDVEEELDTKHQAETDKVLAEVGWVRTEESFRDTYGDGYERKVAKAETPKKPTVGAAGPDDDEADAKARSDQASFAADDPRPLYVYRRLLNADALMAWAREQGFTSTMPPEQMHVTVAYSKRPVNWFGIGTAWGDERNRLRAEGGPRMVELLGEEGAVVLHFSDDRLDSRHREMRRLGASWDFPSYLPHVTFTYDPGSVDLARVKPYLGPLVFGPEIFEPIVDDWQSSMREVGFAEGEPGLAPDRTDDLLDSLIAADGYRIAGAMTGPLIERIAAAANEEDVLAILQDTAGDEGPLYEALHRASFAFRMGAASGE